MNFHDHIRANNARTILVFFLFFILIGALGLVLGLYLNSIIGGLLVTLVIGGIYALIGFFQSKSIVAKMAGARLVTKQEYPHVFHSIEGLAIAAGIPTPQMYVIDSPALNAFASGISPKDAAVTLTTGIIEKLSRQELEGVIAHEIAHIQNYDIRVMVMSAVLLGVVSMLAQILVRAPLMGETRDRKSQGAGIIIIVGIILAILAPIFAQLIHLAISRKREYLADATGALLTRYPPGLANALTKLKSSPPLEHADGVAHMCISEPRKRSFASFLSTHPPIDERIRRLKAM